MLVAVLTAPVTLFAIYVWIEEARLPYNSEGRYFDGVVVYHVEDVDVLAAIACAAVVLTGGAGFLSWRLRRR